MLLKNIQSKSHLELNNKNSQKSENIIIDQKQIKIKNLWKKISNSFIFICLLKNYHQQKEIENEEIFKKLKKHDGKIRFEMEKFIEPFLVNFINSPLNSKNIIVFFNINFRI